MFDAYDFEVGLFVGALVFCVTLNVIPAFIGKEPKHRKGAEAMTYKNIEEWLTEVDGYGTREERMAQAITHARRVQWLNEAWKQGAAAERERLAKLANRKATVKWVDNRGVNVWSLADWIRSQGEE